jgi:glycogen(starch) synthase
VPVGVDPERWQAPPGAVNAARLRYAGEGPLLVYAGRLAAEKGVDDLVLALPTLRAYHPGLRIVIAGDGPARSGLLDEIRGHKLHRAVSLTGHLDPAALAAVMGAADAVVVPSRYEPLGTVAVEAAAAGAPVAVAATGGLAEIVAPGETGTVFRPGDPRGLADAVSTLLAEPAAARAMADRARVAVAERFSWSSIAGQVAQIYEEAAGIPVSTRWALARSNATTASGAVPGEPAR